MCKKPALGVSGEVRELYTEWDGIHDMEAEAFERGDFFGRIREEVHIGDAERMEALSASAVEAEVRWHFVNFLFIDSGFCRLIDGLFEGI